MAMSTNRLNRICNYWCFKMFLQNPDFRRVLSRTDFSNFCGCVRLYPSYDNEVASKDPLWHSRVIMLAFNRNAASVAVPTGFQSLDELSVRCCARTTATTYIPNKPIKYGIRFYTVVGHNSKYIHSIFDNNSGNKTGLSLSDSYCALFRSLR